VRTLRQTLAEIIVRVHLIPPDLADYHVRRMTPREVKQRFLFYVRAGLSKPGAELSAASAKSERSTCLPSRFVTPATTQARSRHSTLVPEAVEG
jgi:hypothetical protein